jgi:prophage DNA circulation protein
MDNELEDRIYQAVTARVLADVAPVVQAFATATQDSMQTLAQMKSEISAMVEQFNQSQSRWHELIASVQSVNSMLADEVARLNNRVAALEDR